MPQYLRLADNIYNTFKQEKWFNDDSQELINLIFRQLRKNLKDTDLKLKVNFIEMNDGFVTAQKSKLNFDISLVPSYKNKDEFILWLAGFIEKVTEGGVKKLPPLYNNIPEEFTFKVEKSKVPTKANTDEIASKNILTKSYDDLIAYFDTVDFKKNNNKKV